VSHILSVKCYWYRGLEEWKWELLWFPPAVSRARRQWRIAMARRRLKELCGTGDRADEQNSTPS
jgi:hypothetical protein